MDITTTLAPVNTVSGGGGGDASQHNPNNILFIVIAVIGAIVVMGSIFLFRLYVCNTSPSSSDNGATSWDEECQDPSTKRRSRLKSLVEEKTVRAEYKDYKILQRRRMSTMVSSFDEGSFDEESAVSDTPPTDNGAAQRHLHMVVSSFQLESGNQTNDEGAFCPDWKMHTNGATDCAVCLGEYKPDDMVCELECGHVFHEDCLFKWFLRSDNVQCPLCRYDLEDESTPPPRNRLQSEEQALVGFSGSPLNNV
ncbi:hypothetical protein FOL47_000187 [Perkinsus chesapeaki]|uniref:RING-type domain-containing protein n=1 Tax=Perkinsus chesapeaki TaxID=330153 RepID=A0A7J6KWP1_PERCH|nr:hypothetical protein FOL47_000187 [Perkinsus chesapeaki]